MINHRGGGRGTDPEERREVGNKEETKRGRKVHENNNVAA